MHDDLEYLLRQVNKEVIYVPNPGNAGDSFIAHATYQLLNRLGIRYEVGRYTETYSDRILVFGGGGSLVPLYPETIDFISRNRETCRELIVLPHTIRGYSDVFGKLGSNAFVFCREKPSYDFVKSCALSANVFLSHDLAFACDFDVTNAEMRKHRLRNILKFLRHIRSNVRYEIDLQRKIARSAGILNAFRTDVYEKTSAELPDDNFDVSAVFSDWDMSPIRALQTTYRMSQFIGQFRVVNTNRLHVAIMAAMLGLEVHFCDNSYGKNRDVFVHSIRDRFTNVHWH
jgi:exopolysaccharide biosynthesis predicted pyruvyltransferase EpsI